MPDETYKRLRLEPESWTVEIHTVEVYVGTDGDLCKRLYLQHFRNSQVK